MIRVRAFSVSSKNVPILWQIQLDWYNAFADNAFEVCPYSELLPDIAALSEVDLCPFLVWRRKTRHIVTYSHPLGQDLIPWEVQKDVEYHQTLLELLAIFDGEHICRDPFHHGLTLEELERGWL
jgi:hypothetical protein